MILHISTISDKILMIICPNCYLKTDSIRQTITPWQFLKCFIVVSIKGAFLEFNLPLPYCNFRFSFLSSLPFTQKQVTDFLYDTLKGCKCLILFSSPTLKSPTYFDFSFEGFILNVYSPLSFSPSGLQLIHVFVCTDLPFRMVALPVLSRVSSLACLLCTCILLHVCVFDGQQ